MNALPGDPTFNPLSNHYDAASYKRICAEFGIDSALHKAHLHKAKTTVLCMCSLCTRRDRQKQNSNIQDLINSVMRAAKRSKEI